MEPDDVKPVLQEKSGCGAVVRLSGLADDEVELVFWIWSSQFGFGESEEGREE